MATVTEHFCDFCGDPRESGSSDECEAQYFTAKVLKRIAKGSLGIIRRRFYVYDDSSHWETKKYDMCPKCFRFLQDLCKAGAHLPTVHYKNSRQIL